MRGLIALVAAAALLSACGNTQTDRAISGAGIGAATGAAGAAIVGGSVGGAAALGGAVGAAAGAITDQSQIDLGNPVWR